jgi:glycosyltransferase involved in cell wall biosynthesis
MNSSPDSAVAARPLRIVHTEASCGWGGQEIRILTEAQGMMGRGHAVTLLCPAAARIFPAAQARGIPVVDLPIARQSLKGLVAVRRWLRANPIDVVNTHSSTDSWLVALALATLRTQPVMVRTRHISAPVPRNWPTRWLYLRATQHIVTTGEALRRQLIDENGYPPHHLTSVPTGIDITRFAPGDRAAARAALDLPKDAFIVGIVATLRSWKGHHYLVEALARLKDPTARLLIVGDGPMRDVLARQIAEHGIKDRVSMPGNQEDVVPWLRAMDVFVLPSYANEGVPQAILQAMACGLPVVTTTVGGIEEVVANDTNGVVIAPRRADLLLEALERLRAHPELRTELGRAAVSAASSRFGIDRMLDGMEAVFRAGLQTHG